MKLLHIDSSILKAQSVSRKLTASIVNQLTLQAPKAEIIYHDLDAQPIGHLLIAEFLATRGVKPLDQGSIKDVDRNSELLDKFLAADVVVIGAPMYNFSVPSQLKAWLDRIAVVGKTFQYTANGTEGLVKNKRIIIASTRGGLYNEDVVTALFDHQETYLKAFFNFLGITDITFIRAEGLSIGDEFRSAAINTAMIRIEQLD